ncbi:hypothetical protein EOA25_04670 [Mesorhizobium sp. M2A.F.Ca.ET.040.01.1.1]|nr:hypothetical protein EOA25_04670 [Mesorhizobium sp. M2A.F.Ca.ET.040.01.1.1]
MSLNLALVVSGNASGAKDATQQTKGAIGSLRAEAVSASTAMAAANDQVVASARRATEAATAQEAAQRRLQTSIQSMFAAAQPTGEASYQKRAADIAAYGAALDRLKARYDPLFAAQQKYQAAIEAINQAERTGAISASLAIDARLRETAALNGQISALNGVAAAQKNAAQAMVNRVTIVPDRGADIEAYGQQLDALRARFNPVYAAIAQYKTAVMEAREAERLGAISSDEMTAAIGRQRQATLASIAAIKSRQTAANSNNPRLSGPQLQGLGYQANDVVTMAMMGAPLSQIAASQGGQILQTLQMGEGGVSGSLSAIKGSMAAAATATAGFLGTVGMIAAGFGVAGAAALAFYVLTREKAKSLDELMKQHEETLKDLGNAYGDVAAKSKGVFSAANQNSFGIASSNTINGLKLSIAQANRDALSQILIERGSGASGNQFGPAQIVNSQFSFFEGAIEHLRKTARDGQPDILGFRKMVEDRWATKPNDDAVTVAAGKLMELTKDADGAAKALLELEIIRKRLFDDVGPNGFLLSRGTSNRADMGSLSAFETQQAIARHRAQQSFDAEVLGINARSPQERAAAARAAATATYNNDETPAARAQRIELAGKKALIDSEHQLTVAQQERMRSLDQTIASAQLDVSLIGKSTAETEALRFENERLAQVREEAARNGVEVDQAEIASIHAKAVEYGKLIALQEARSRLKGEQDDLELQQAELRLVGAGALARQRAIDALKTEQYIRQSGIPLYGEEAEELRKNTAARSANNEAIAKAQLAQDLLFERQQMFRSETEQTVASTMKNAGLEYDPNSMIAQQIRYNEQLKTTKAAWEDIFNTVNDGFDSVSDALFSGGSIGEALKKAGSQFAKTIFDMSLTNPLKNWMTGSNFNTIGDLGIFPGAWSGKGGGFGGVLGQMLGAQKAVASMQVQAASVFINGSPLGVPGLPGVPGAANDNGGFFGWLKSLFGGTPAASNTVAGPNTAATAAKLLSGLGSPLGANVDSATTSSIVGQALGFVGNYKSGVDPRLTDILNTAAKQFAGFKVDAFSGFRLGDPRFHGQGLATDVRLTDLLTGKALGNYQNAGSFGTYEQFAQLARRVQMDKYPELADQFRWGGYFGGGRGKYGAMDEMHFDLGGGRLGMGGGSWANGLTSAQRALFPGANSVGAAALDKLGSSATSAASAVGSLGGASTSALSSLVSSTGAAAKGLDVFGSGAGKLGSMLNQFPAAPGGGGGSPFGFLGNIFGSLFGGGGGLNPAFSGSAAFSFLSANPGGFIGLYANGAAFNRGNVVPFARGDVFSTPTYFPMSAGRTGVLGEDGEEAIMPLRRGPDGRLGVVNHQPLRAPRAANGNGGGAGSGGGATREMIRGIVSEIADKMRFSPTIVNVNDGSDIKRWLMSDDGHQTVAVVNRRNGGN